MEAIYDAFPLAKRMCETLLKIGVDEKRVRLRVVRHMQEVGFAADLTVFHIILSSSCGLVDRRWIPFSAARTLKARIHEADCSFQSDPA
jgi:hypothetical protein